MSTIHHPHRIVTRSGCLFSVRSDFRHGGVRWEMLENVAKHAEALGLATLESIESRKNHAAIELERDMGFTARSYTGDATLMLLERKLGQPAV